MANIYKTLIICYFCLLVIKMGLWSKVKGVFGRIGNGLKNYVLKPALSLVSTVGAPVGAAIGSIVPGIGTAIGGTVGGAAQALAGGLNKMIG